ncbi:MAG: type V CRISPR-associated endonuclease Cas1 [Spirochaetia bacterium]|nr:type V CRISPR-associated endonuclease Cas1 [Spirochaetia bacterium]
MLSLKDFQHKSIVFIFSKEDKIRFSNENLVFEEKDTGKIKNQMPCIKIFAVIVIGSITITSHLLEKSSKYGFSLIFLKDNFKPYSYMGAYSEGNTLLKEKQYLQNDNFNLSLYFVRLKISNQVNNLKYLRNKNSEISHAIERISDILYGLGSDENGVNSKLLGKEGNASKIYFKAYFSEHGWQSRKPRTKIDPINTLMDIGYTFLFNFIEANLRLYGFDVYKGFYHRLFYQRKSLVCDFVEPFRCIIDKNIRKGFNLKKYKDEDFKLLKNIYVLRKNKSRHYTDSLFHDLLDHKEEIFIFIQKFYRCFFQDKDIREYPIFSISN